MPAAPPMIRARHLTREYDELKALSGLTLDVGQGDCYGLIGPNGAGKTTLLRILATLLLPSDGRAYVGPHEVADDPDGVRSLIGYMPDTLPTLETMTVREVLEYFGRCHAIVGNRLPRRVRDVLELVDLSAKEHSLVSHLSRGMRQRLCLGQTLMHDPQVLLLDEPASGLDPEARIEFRTLMKELRAMGKTIVISSHILTELSDFCNAVGIVEKGRLVLGGRVEDILARMKGTRTLQLDFLGDPGALRAALGPVATPGAVAAGPAAGALAASATADPGSVVPLADLAPTAHDALETSAAAGADSSPAVRALLGKIVSSSVNGQTATLEFAGAREEVADLLRHLVEHGVRLVSFHEYHENLEDIFLRVAANKTS